VGGVILQRVINWNNYANFNATEFNCRCGCGAGGERVSLVLMNMLQRARTRAGIPFSVNSGGRCQKHAAQVSTASNTLASDHTFTASQLVLGADIRTTDNAQRWRIIDAAQREGFTRIGIGNGFVHLGIGTRENAGARNPSNVIWLY